MTRFVRGAPRLTHSRPSAAIRDEPLEGRADGLKVHVVEHQTGDLVLHQFTYTAYIGSGHRQPGPHRFDDADRETFVVRNEDEQVAVSEAQRHIFTFSGKCETGLQTQ